MGKTFRKHVLSPGTFWTRSGPVTFSDRDVRHFHETGREMLAAGLQIPVPLEHQDTAKPQTHAERLARSVLFNTGFVKDYELENGKDLYYTYSPDESELAATGLNVTADQLSAKLPTSIKYVSPEVTPVFVDGNGRRWENCITHVALTPQPVFHGQQGFDQAGTDGTKLLSVSRPALPWRRVDAPIRLSMAAEVIPDRHGWRLAITGGTSMHQLSRDSKMAKPDKKKFDLDGDGDADISVPPDDDDALSPPPPSEVTPSTTDHVAEAMADMAELGIVMPDDTNDQNFAERLCTAIKTHKATKNLKEKENSPMSPTTAGAQMPKEEVPTVSLSLQQVTGRLAKVEKDLADERFKNFDLALTDLQGKGKCSPAQVKRWKDTLSPKRLSLVTGDSPEVREILAQIEFSKEIPDGTFFSDEERAARLSRAKAEEPPKHARFDAAEMTAERAKKIVDEQFAGYAS